MAKTTVYKSKYKEFGFYVAGKKFKFHSFTFKTDNPIHKRELNKMKKDVWAVDTYDEKKDKKTEQGKENEAINEEITEEKEEKTETEDVAETETPENAETS